MKQFSLQYLLLIVTIICGLCASWTYHPFDDAVQAVVRHGGGVSYDDRMVGISFAAWMPTMFATLHVVTHQPLEETAEDLSDIYDDLRYLAHQRPLMRVEFSSSEQAQAMKEHFEHFPVEGYRVDFKKRSSHSFAIVLKRETS